MCHNLKRHEGVPNSEICNISILNYQMHIETKYIPNKHDEMILTCGVSMITMQRGVSWRTFFLGVRKVKQVFLFLKRPGRPLMSTEVFLSFQPL